MIKLSHNEITQLDIIQDLNAEVSMLKDKLSRRNIEIADLKHRLDKAEKKVKDLKATLKRNCLNNMEPDDFDIPEE